MSTDAKVAIAIFVVAMIGTLGLGIAADARPRHRPRGVVRRRALASA